MKFVGHGRDGGLWLSLTGGIQWCVSFLLHASLPSPDDLTRYLNHLPFFGAQEQLFSSMAMRRGIACSLLLFIVAVTHAFVRPAAPSSIQVRKQQHPGAPRGPPENSGLTPLQAKGSGPEFGRKQAKRDLMERQRAMAEFNAEIETTPVFQVFAATQKMKGLWMPVAAFKADNVAKGVVDASLQEGIAANMFKGVYKAQVETAVSKAIFDNERRLREQGQAMHATLKNAPRDQIIWGFKILYKPLQDKVCEK